MVGVVLELAQKDNNFIIQNGGFEQPLNILCFKDNKEYLVNGTVFNVSITIDPDTHLNATSRKINILINKASLRTINYPMYNIQDGNDKDVTMTKDIIKFMDANGVEQTVAVEQTNPDYSLDHILLQVVKNDQKRKRISGNNFIQK